MFNYYLLITGILIGAGFFIRRSRLLPLVQIIWIWLIMAFSNGGADYKGHLEIYALGKSKQFVSVFDIFAPDKLYLFLCELGGNAGLNFFQFNMITVSIGLIGLCYIVFKECNNPSVVFSFYMLFPLPDSVIQKRFFLSSIVILFAILVLRNRGKWFWIKYIVLVIIATGLHSANIFYFVLLPLDFISYKNLKKWVGILVPTIVIGISIVPIIADKILGGSVKVYTYFIKRSMRLDSFYKVIVFVMVQVIFMSIHYFLFKCDGENYIFYRKLDVSMLVVAPLYYYSSTFLRYYRTILPLYYIKVADKFNDEHKYNLRLLVALILYTAYVVWIFLFSYVLFGQLRYEVLIKGLFEHNEILGTKIRYY